MKGKHQHYIDCETCYEYKHLEKDGFNLQELMSDGYLVAVGSSYFMGIKNKIQDKITYMVSDLGTMMFPAYEYQNVIWHPHQMEMVKAVHKAILDNDEQVKKIYNKLLYLRLDVMEVEYYSKENSIKLKSIYKQLKQVLDEYKFIIRLQKEAITKINFKSPAEVVKEHASTG